MPTAEGKPSLMDAILNGDKPKNFFAIKPVTDWVGDGVESPIDGNVYRTKSEYLNHLKQNNAHITEMSPESSRKERLKKKDAEKKELQKAVQDQKEFLQGRLK
jgi:hypothetical protein